MKKLIMAAVAALSLHVPVTQAAIVTFNYTGQIGFTYQYFWGANAHIEYPSTFVIGGTTLTIGDTFHGQFSYDTSTRLTPVSEYDWTTNSYKPSTTQFAGAAPRNAATLIFDNKTYVYRAPNNGADSGSTLTVFDNNQYLNDYFQHRTELNDQGVQSALSLTFANANDKTVLNGPIAPSSLTQKDFPRSFIDFSYRAPNSPYSFEILGDINTFEQVAAPVPEPETYAMVLAGLALVGWAARRRRNQPAN